MPEISLQFCQHNFGLHIYSLNKYVLWCPTHEVTSLNLLPVTDTALVSNTDASLIALPSHPSLCQTVFTIGKCCHAYW